MVNLVKELGRIADCSFKYGVDPYFICAIRRQENGPEGKEFGVSTTKAKDYASQLDVACRSVRNKLAAFKANPLQRRISATGSTRIAYTESFVEAFANIWRPVNGGDDENRYWPGNVVRIYYDLLNDPNALMRYSKDA